MGPEAGIQKSEAGIQKPEAGIQKPEAGIQKPETGIGNRRPEVGNRRPEIGGPRTEKSLEVHHLGSLQKSGMARASMGFQVSLVPYAGRRDGRWAAEPHGSMASSACGYSAYHVLHVLVAADLCRIRLHDMAKRRYSSLVMLNQAAVPTGVWTGCSGDVGVTWCQLSP
jgi:hypothetical protein